MTKIIVVSLHTLKFSGFKVAVQGSVEERPVTFTLVDKSDTEIMNVLFINQVSFFFENDQLTCDFNQVINTLDSTDPLSVLILIRLDKREIQA